MSKNKTIFPGILSFFLSTKELEKVYNGKDKKTEFNTCGDYFLDYKWMVISVLA